MARHLDFDAAMLRRVAKDSKDAGQTCRLRALAAIYKGTPRTEAARIGGMTLQVIRDWILRLDADGPDGLIDRKAPGAVPKRTAERCAALGQGVDQGPDPAVPGVVGWRLGPGIPIDRIKPGRPSSCRRRHRSVSEASERMHFTLKKETTKPAAFNVLQQQDRFDKFTEAYNNTRPHQALGGADPGDLDTARHASPRRRPNPTTIRSRTAPRASPVADQAAPANAKSI